MVFEYLNDEEQALDSFCDALLVEEENPELNKNLENYYLSKKVLVKAILNWAVIGKPHRRGKNISRLRSGKSFVLNS